MKLLLAAAAASLALGASAAHATTYDLGTLTTDEVTASPQVKYSNTSATDQTYADYFNFTIDGNYDESTSAGFIEGGKYDINSAVLSLFDASTSTLITSTGAFDPNTTVAPTLMATLTPGSYYVRADVTVAAGHKGAYTVNATVDPTSAAPEPGTWALMFAGVGLAGFALRRRQGSAALA